MPLAEKYLNNHDSLLIFLQFDQSSQQPEPELKPDAGQQEQPQPEPEPEPEPAQAGRPELVYLSFSHLNIATSIFKSI